jgi:hypothetical protein
MVAVPAATPVTSPDGFTVAIPVALLLHEPPSAASVRCVTSPMHIIGEPVMGSIAFTATAAMAGVQEPMA